MTNQLVDAVNDLLAWHAVEWNGEPSEAMDTCVAPVAPAVEDVLGCVHLSRLFKYVLMAYSC